MNRRDFAKRALLAIPAAYGLANVRSSSAENASAEIADAKTESDFFDDFSNESETVTRTTTFAKLGANNENFHAANLYSYYQFTDQDGFSFNYHTIRDTLSSLGVYNAPYLVMEVYYPNNDASPSITINRFPMSITTHAEHQAFADNMFESLVNGWYFANVYPMMLIENNGEPRSATEAEVAFMAYLYHRDFSKVA